MSVKKGKGIVQEKENLKQLIDEKSAEIEGLRSEMQQKESIIDDCRDQITRLSVELGRVPQLEGDLAALRDQTTYIEKDLMESNKLLQSLMEFINGIVNPLGSEFEDPMEKVKWLGEYLSNCQAEKEIVEQELKTVKLDAETSASELLQVNSTIKSLEFALEQAEGNLSVVSNEKNAAENEMFTLTAKLNACMEELSGMHGGLESQSVELVGHLKDLELLITEEPIFSFLEQCSRKKMEALREMDLMFRNIRNQFAAVYGKSACYRGSFLHFKGPRGGSGQPCQYSI